MVKIENLSVEYEGGRRALDGISFGVAEGESVALLGANGAGKSTLLKALAGLAPICAGSAEICGLKVERKNLRQIRSCIGFVFQNSDDQMFSLTVEEDVMFGLRNMGLDAQTAAQTARKTMSDLGISHLAKRSPARLSEGEKKRSAIACVLAMRPKILLFDEPTASLDARSARELCALLKSLPCAKIVATHDLNAAKNLCGKAAVLSRSRLVKFGDCAEILADEKLLFDCSLI
ncbi:MAG: ABC transporter ATP-binding protein [Opitutales bacterium]|nr:ABC transporter ATP-binding protein [Opitutales bacterium]